MNKGRPKQQVNWEKVDKLILKGWTTKQIHNTLHISYLTLIRRCKEQKGMNFKNYRKTINDEQTI